MSSDTISKPSVISCDTCQVCKAHLPEPVLNLGMQALCDDLIPVGDPRENIKYPIQIKVCHQCLTAHQAYHLPKEILFPPSYHYRPRFTQDVLNGMRELVEGAATMLPSLEGKLVCDVGCNDGSLLSIFGELGAKTCGIEPTGASEEALAAGHVIINDFFNPDTARQMVSKVGKPDFITFTNVFAHIESLDDAFNALGEMVHDNTLVIIENHYLGSVIDSNQFDTFYHEHPRSYSLRSFEFIAKALGGELLLTTFPKRYAGNVRVIIGNFNGSTTHQKRNADEANIRDESSFPADLAKMQKFVNDWKVDTRSEIQKLIDEGLVIHGKSFPGRAAILISLLDITDKEQPFVYEKPGSLKIGHYLPGTRIEILSDDDWMKADEQPAAMIIWGWHIAEEIKAYLRQNGYRGRLFTPLPHFHEMI